MKRLKLILGVLLAAGILSVAPFAHATDIAIYPTGPVYRLTGLVWGTSTVPGFNNNYFFTPLAINENICVSVYNNNPTNSHPFTANIVVTGNPSNVTPSDGTWTAAATSSNLNSQFTSGGFGQPAGIGASINGAAQVSINLSASGTLAGNPDTANVTISQTPGSCFSGNGFVGSSPATVSSFTPLQSISDGLSQAYSSQTGVIVNPANASHVINLSSNGGVRNIFIDHFTVFCTAACSITINTTSSIGITCSVPAIINTKVSSAVTPQSTVTSACTGVPVVVSPIFTAIPILANTLTAIDMRGFIGPNMTTNGIDIVMAAVLAGNINVQAVWYEK